MGSNFQRPPILVAPIILAILGVAYCLFTYLGVGESVCVTAGCSLYKSFSIAGISMWIFGLISFVCLTLIMAAGLHTISLYIAWLFLVADCILLLLMVTTSPCLSCLGVALLYALIYFLLRKPDHNGNKSPSGLLFIWSLLFVSTLVLSAREIFPPEPIYGNADAPVHIYFSPSCEYCIEAMDRFSLSDEQVAYYATANDANDISVLIAVNQRLRDGGEMPEALKEVLANSSALPPITLNLENVILQWQLWRNKATVIERSNGIVPYITIQGLPISDLSHATNKKQRLIDADSPRTFQGGTSTPGTPGTSGLPSLSDQISLGNTDGADSSNILYEKDIFILSNSTGFGACTDESPENCD